MKKILGIDQSYTGCGLCVVDESGDMFHFERYKTDPEKDIYDRAIELADVVIKYIQKYSVTHVNIEGLAFGMRGNATRDLAGLIFVLITNMRAKTPGVTCSIIAPTSLKKFATGSGKSDKAAMISSLPANVLQAFEEAKFKKTTGLADLTDAFWLAKHGKQ